MTDTTATGVAIYWDFENLHASLCEHRGERYTPYIAQERLVQVDAVMALARTFGPIRINRAYAHWARLFRYRDDLLAASIDLVQLFPLGGGTKNGADIRLCLDVMEDIALHATIGTVVVVSGDSDFVALAHKLRPRGRRLVGVGTRSATSPFWAASCEPFHYYDDLPGVALPWPEPPPPPMAPASEDARLDAILIATAADLARQRPDLRVPPEGAPAEAPETPPDTPASPPAAAGMPERPEAPGAPEAPASGPPPEPDGGPQADADAPAPEAPPPAEPAPPGPEAGAARHDEARHLVRTALRDLAQTHGRGDGWVDKALLKPKLQMLTGTGLPERKLGYGTFAALMEATKDVFELRRGETRHDLRLRHAV